MVQCGKDDRSGPSVAIIKSGPSSRQRSSPCVQYSIAGTELGTIWLMSSMSATLTCRAGQALGLSYAQFTPRATKVPQSPLSLIKHLC